MSDSDAQPAPKRQRPKRSLRYRLIRGSIITIVSLVLLVVIAGEIFFATALPRDVVISAVQKQLRLTITAKSLSTGWFGHTTLHDVTLGLPLADKAFVTVPELEISHSSPVVFAITGNLTIKSIAFDKPTIYVMQEAGGQWNLQQVAQILGRTGGGGNAGSGTQAASSASGQQDNSVPQLPAIDVRNATLIIMDNNGRKSTIAPLTVTGRSENSLVWQYDAQCEDRLKVTGRVAPGGIWAHEVQLSVSNIGEWMNPWIKNWPASASLTAHWSGQLINNQVAGQLMVDDGHWGLIDARGPVQIGNENGAMAIRPQGLVINGALAVIPHIRADGGEVLVKTSSLEAQHISIAAAGGNAAVDGKYSLTDGAASIHAVWQNLSLFKGQQSGDFSADYTIPFPGKLKVTANINSNAVYSGGKFDGVINFNGEGAWGRPIDWKINAPKLRWDGNNHLSADMSGFIATLVTSKNGAVLSNMHVGEKTPVAGSGGYDTSKQLWWIALHGRGWPLPGKHGTLDLDLNTWGNPSLVHVSQFFVSSKGVSLSSEGEYVFNQPKPVTARVYITEAPQMTESEIANAWIRGSLDSSFALTGTVEPIDLTFTGDASGSQLYLKNRRVGDLNFKLHGTIGSDPDIGPWVNIQSEDISLFGGQGSLDGTWPVKDKLLSVAISAKNISLADATNRQDIAGRLDGKWILGLTEVSLNGVQIDQDGPTVIRDLAIGNTSTGHTGECLAIDRVTIQRSHVEEGDVTIDPILLERHDSGVDGRATLGVSTTLLHPTQLSVRLDTDSWPYRHDGSPLLAVGTGNGKVDIDIARRSVFGHVDVRTDAILNDKNLGDIDIAADLRERVIDASSIKIKSMGGEASGKAVVDLDHLTQSVVSLNMSGIDAAQLGAAIPAIKDLSGRLDGSLDLHPSVAPRPLGPTAFAIMIHPQAGRFRGFGYGDLQVNGYLGSYRLVLDDAPQRPSFVNIAGGQVQFWYRISKHDQDQYQSLARFDLHHLDLNQIAHLDPKAKYTPGQVDGQLTIIGRPNNLDLDFGNGEIQLSHCDLATVGPITMLYNLMHIGHDPKKPVGSGTINLSLEHKTVIITAMRYFDRGTEVRGNGTIDNITGAPNLSRLNIIVSGSARPFSQINLPGISDLDAALSAVQHDTLSVLVYGTLHKPQWRSILFDDLTDSMKQLLVGDVRSEDPSEE